MQEVAARLSAWGDCRVLGLLAGGYRSSVMLVECDGSRFVAKSSRRTAEAIAWLEPVQQSARRVGFVVPHFRRSRCGELLVDGVTLEEWIEGNSPSVEELTPLEGLIDSFHTLTSCWRQRPGFASTQELLRVERGGDVDLSRMPQELVEACRAAWRKLLGSPLSVVHGDLNRANLIVTRDGRLALVDWDEARVDVPLLDRAAVSRAKGGADVLPPEVWRALLAREVASSWLVEPEYAERLAGELLSS